MSRGIFRWNPLPRFKIEAIAFTMTAHDETFQPSSDGNSGKSLCIAFANAEALTYGLVGGLTFNTVPEKGVNIIFDVVMAPHKDGSSLVSVGRERSA
jgi:hypothetical protein